MSATEGVGTSIDVVEKYHSDDICEANFSILTCKSVWISSMELFSNVHTKILLEAVSLAGKQDEAIVQPTRAAILGGLDAVRVAQVFGIFMKLLKIQTKAEELRTRINLALGEISETGADWNGEAPNAQDLEKLSSRECRKLVKKWKNGETFIQGWVPIFEGMKAEWNEMKVKIEHDIDNCIKEMIEVHKAAIKNLIKLLMDTEVNMDKPWIALRKNILQVLKEFAGKIRNFTVDIKKAAGFFTEEEAQWKDKVPELQDLWELPVRDRKRLVQNGEDGETFTLIWISVFKEFKRRWDSMMRQLKEDIQHHFTLAGIPYEESFITDLET